MYLKFSQISNRLLSIQIAFHRIQHFYLSGSFFRHGVYFIYIRSILGWSDKFWQD